MSTAGLGFGHVTPLDRFTDGQPECVANLFHTPFFSLTVMSDAPAREKPAINPDPSSALSTGTSPSNSRTPSESPGSRHSPALQIPEPTDGFFGYSEEKTLRHVRRRSHVFS